MTLSIPLKLLVRCFAAELCRAVGFYELEIRKWALERHSLIVMYHRINSPQKTNEYIEPGMFVTPETFCMHCRLLKRYFNVVPLSVIASNKIPTSQKPLCVITFDDGWSDFYSNAFPHLLAENLPATVFLPTDYIGTDERFWTDSVGLMLNRAYIAGEKPIYTGSVSIIKDIFNFNGSTISQIDRAIKLLKPYSSVQIKEIVHELARAICFTEKLETAFLTWDEVRGLRRTGLVSFGSHTAGHLILTSESERIAEEELIRSREKLLDEHAVDPQFISFCYPNGGFSSKIQKIVEKAQYHCAVTTKCGWNDSGCDQFSLKRVGMHQDMTSTSALTLARLAQK